MGCAGPAWLSLVRSAGWAPARGSQRDVVNLGCPIAPSYMSPNARGGGGGVAGPQPMSTTIHRSPNKLWRSKCRAAPLFSDVQYSSLLGTHKRILKRADNNYFFKACVRCHSTKNMFFVTFVPLLLLCKNIELLVFVKLLRSPGIDFQPGGGPVRQPYLMYRLHRLAESTPWNRFLGFLNVYKFGLR